MIADACAGNHIPNSWGVLQHFGQRHRNRVTVAESEEIDVSGLAHALRVPVEEVTSRRYTANAAGHRLFFGLPLNPQRIEDRVRRFSPAAIGAGQLHHPATHELRDLPFSTIGWDLLVDTCPCSDTGVRQGWTRISGTARCDDCGRRLDHIDPIWVPDQLKSPLQWLANLIDPNELMQRQSYELLPAPLKTSNRTLLFDIAVLLGKYLAGKNPDPLRRVESLAVASEAILDWPNGIKRLRPNAADRKLARATRNYLLLAMSEEVPSETGSKLISNSTKASIPKTVYSPAGVCGRISRANLISAVEASRRTGIDEFAFKFAWDEGRVTPHYWVRGNDRLRAFDPDEVSALAPTLRRATARRSASKLLGISVFGLEQLDALGLFQPLPPSPIQNQAETHRVEVERLIQRLQEASSEDINEPISIFEAARYISGRPKPWGAIIQSLLGQEISFILGAESQSLTKRTFIQKSQLAQLTRITFAPELYPHLNFETHWSQGDALECVNGNKDNPEHLGGIASLGTTPKLYLAADVQRLAAEGVTTSDLARRAGISISRAICVLEADRVPRVAAGIWVRRAAEQSLGI
jgi:hypothetical protein